ncbi:UDP-N-acetylglucosamine--N-acetylmuramyl-(pentapeptide) pyrophosphoryl-undecaprenol N-acetylglucosamine transferase [Candidatus Nomurabacteria bacterium]|nr:UDP-N-acetylglucosamine--N-acetylmuramyl-(pentapeptide) pyrophosphoryl-undecaprenol N-acetylglucosamine transferase [Candidatus Nomurabacteria bacterium]
MISLNHMKIVFAGGGTGGHFYPIIAVAQKVNQIIDKEHIISPKLYYLSDSPYDKEMLLQNGLIFEEIKSGKMRVYFSLRNFLDVFKTFFGTINSIYKVFTIYPDVVFGKGGYASFPTILAARILSIPVVIHESDSAPGRVNKWAGHFAKRVAISFPESAAFFPKKTTAWTGQPIIQEILYPTVRDEALEYFKFESNSPVIFILGGSQGAELINNTILDALPRLIENYQIIHQTGIKNFTTVSGQARVILGNNKHKSRYTTIPYLSPLQMKMASGAASLIVSRSGSTIFQIAAWGVPSILVPFTNSNADHARKNAFSYARSGACSVVEEANMTANILSGEIERILNDKAEYEKMKKSTKAFNKPGAAEKIAQELVDIAMSHEGK